jgi:hypothetical protein
VRTTARGLLALLAGLLTTAGLLSATTVPASAGQVGVTIGIKGAGSVHVVEGSIEDGGALSCVRDGNQDHRVTVTCPRIRNSEPFEAWVWLRAIPSAAPAGEWKLDKWSGCNQTRTRDGYSECGVYSGAFSSDERHPVAEFLDTVRPAITGFEVRQEPGLDRTFRLSFGTATPAQTECRWTDRHDFIPCFSGSVVAVPEGVYTVQLRALDQSGNQSLAERTVASVDTRIIRGPAAHSNDRMPAFELDSEAGDHFSCSVDRGPYEPCGNGVESVWHTLTGLADGPHTLSVRANHAEWVDPVPAEWSWTMDTVAPTSTITAQIDGTSAAFGFHSSESTTYECRLDTPAGPGSWVPCPRMVGYTDLAQGEHQLWLRAQDLAGNLQVTPVFHRWTVDSIAPTTGLAASTTTDRATFTFSAPGAASYECRLTTPSGPGSWAACTSPMSYTGLVPGPHRFEVRATDAAGNVEAVPATHAWTATAPVSPPAQVPGTPTPFVPAPEATRSASATKATWKVSPARRGKVTVVVSARSVPTGSVVVTDRGRVIARATLSVSDDGRVVVTLPRLKKGKHVLLVKYGGSATTVGSSSSKRTLTLG